MHTSTLLELRFFVYSRDHNLPCSLSALCAGCCTNSWKGSVCVTGSTISSHCKSIKTVHICSMGVVSLKALIPSVSLACYSFACVCCQSSSCLFPGMGRTGLRSIRQKSYWELLVVLHLANLSISMLVMRRLSGLCALEQLNSLSQS